jgi:hypothetical protein
MIRWALETFVTQTMGRGEISRADVNALRRDVLPDGIETRDEADVLIALDRALHDKHESWTAFMVDAIVDFAVWASRPTGRIDRDTAEWLVASLGSGTGPSETAVTIAFEIVREAEASDEVLVAFVLRSRSRRAGDLAVGRSPELVF